MSASSCITDEQALDLIEGRLAPEVREEIDVHLDGCPSCRELVSAFALTAADITESAPRSEPSGPDPASLDRPKGKRALGPLEPGSTLAHFEIVKLLGRGATGEVFVARDQNLGRLVALKIIAPDLVRSPRALRRFLFEAKATSRFNHPHIVTLFEVGEETGHPYVALEYIEGENLKQRAKRDPLAPEDVLDLALSVASALVEAHRLGILHRDLKPANVMLGDNGAVKVVDFGLARAVRGSDEERSEHHPLPVSSAATLVGTPLYMAPEQWQSSDCTGAVDIWAFAMVIFYAFTGTNVFDAFSPVELVRVVNSPDPVASVETLAELAPGWVELLDDCLRKVPEERPSAVELLHRLRVLRDATLRPPPRARAPFEPDRPFSAAQAPLLVGMGREQRDAQWAGRPRLLVHGPSGSGKSTALATQFLPPLRARVPRVMVLDATGDDLAYEALAAAHQTADAWRGTALELIAEELAGSDDPWPADEGAVVAIDGLGAADVDPSWHQLVEHLARTARPGHRLLVASGPGWRPPGDLTTWGQWSPPNATSEELALHLNRIEARSGYRFFPDGFAEELVQCALKGAQPRAHLQWVGAHLWRHRDRQRRRLDAGSSSPESILKQEAWSRFGALSPEVKAQAHRSILELLSGSTLARPQPEVVLAPFVRARLLTMEGTPAAGIVYRLGHPSFASILGTADPARPPRRKPRPWAAAAVVLGLLVAVLALVLRSR